MAERGGIQHIVEHLMWLLCLALLKHFPPYTIADGIFFVYVKTLLSPPTWGLPRVLPWKHGAGHRARMLYRDRKVEQRLGKLPGEVRQML